MKKSIKINERDNVMVMLEATDTVPAGHKAALCDIPEGAPVIKYGNVIGYAKCDIHEGDWVHVHNVRTGLSGKLEYSYEPVDTELPASREEASFMGYRRKNGVGVRNEIWIIPTVGCVNHIAESLARRFEAERPESIDAVVAMTHPYGCSQMGDDQEHTAMILGRMASHPNCGGVLLLSLGCENNNFDHMKPYLKDIDEERTRFLVCQESENELEDAAKLLEELIAIASKDRREKIPASELIVGLKCGGSDGFSGITANPLVGLFSDMLVSAGGSPSLRKYPRCSEPSSSL